MCEQWELASVARLSAGGQQGALQQLYSVVLGTVHMVQYKRQYTGRAQPWVVQQQHLWRAVCSSSVSVAKGALGNWATARQRMLCLAVCGAGGCEREGIW